MPYRCDFCHSPSQTVYILRSTVQVCAPCLFDPDYDHCEEDPPEHWLETDSPFSSDDEPDEAEPDSEPEPRAAKRQRAGTRDGSQEAERSGYGPR
jgi:hypothetical protein